MPRVSRKAVVAEEMPTEDLTDVPAEALASLLANDQIQGYAIRGSSTKTRTIFNRFNEPMEVDRRLVKQQIAKRDPRTGEQIFFLRPRENPLTRLKAWCEICERDVSEPWNPRGNRGDEARRKRRVLFIHYNAKHPADIPELFPDENELRSLMAFALR